VFLKLRRRDGEVPLAYLVPNVITTLSLCSGLASLHFTMREDWERALGALVLAAIFDVLDGRAARMLRVTSRFGAVYDSLSDFLAFGIAPAVLLHQWALNDEGVWGVAAVMIYALATALRLARFTADAFRPETKPAPAYFTGMPSPAACGVALIPPLLSASDTLAWRMPDWGVAIITVLTGLAMVSRLPMFSVKKVRVRREWAVPLLILVALGVVGLVRDAWLTVASLAALYVLLAPVSILTGGRSPAQSADASTPPQAPAR
jgi:CDP-diacylglycerol--serine O-phosphatidyltransferase